MTEAMLHNTALCAPTWEVAPVRLPDLATSDVWLVQLAEAPCEAHEEILSSGERQSLAGDPLRLAARIALRQLLSRYCAITPAEISLGSGPFGKPELRDLPLSFNLARRGKVALIAIAAVGEIGIDLEMHRPLPELAAISALLHPVEHEWLAGLRDGEREAGFYRLWTRKEAALKALGTGIAVGLDGFNVLPDRIQVRPSPQARAQAPACLTLHDLSIGPDFSAALATPPSIGKVRVYTCSPSSAQYGKFP